TSCRSAVQRPPATLLIAPTHPVEVDTVPPQVRSALHCVVRVHLFVVAPLTKMYSPSRRSSADAGLANPTAPHVTAKATAIARVIAMVLLVIRPTRVRAIEHHMFWASGSCNYQLFLLSGDRERCR